MFGQLAKLFGITLLIVLILSILSWYVPGNFWQSDNWENLLRRTALYGILGIGVAFVIMAGGIDLSVGALVCLFAILFAVFAEVEYQEVGGGSVEYISAKESRVCIAGNNSMLDIGDEFRLFGARRANNGLYRVSEVKTGYSFDESSGIFDEGEVTWLTVDGDLGSDDLSGRVAKVFPVDEFRRGDESILLRIGSTFPGVGIRDRIVLLKNTTIEDGQSNLKIKNEEVIDVTQTDAGDLITISDIPDADETWKAIHTQRVQRMSTPVALLAAMAISLLIGLIHGLLVTKLNLQPFVVTLCGFLIYRSFARWLVDDQPQGFSEHKPELGFLSEGELTLFSTGADSSFGIPTPVFFLVVIAAVSIVFLRYTIWGRYILALGKNEEAARYCGIRTHRLIILTYVICAGLAAVGGMLFAMDGNSVTPPTFGNYLELYAIAAAVLGGCSLRGGEGSIVGVIVGTFLMQLIYNATVLLGISQTLELLIIGLVILAAVVSDEALRFLERRFRRSE